MQSKAKKEGSKVKKENAKLITDTIFDISLENAVSKVDVKTVIARKQYIKWSFRLNIKREKKCDGAITIEKGKCSTNLIESIYIGGSILDLNKVLMQDFHYGYFENVYGGKAEMVLTDTDSLMYKSLS